MRPRPRRGEQTRGRRAAAVVGLGGLLLTVFTVALTYRVYRDSERRLLDRQTQEAAAVLTATIERNEASLRAIAFTSDTTGTRPVGAITLAERLVADGSFAGIALVDETGESLASAGDVDDELRRVVDPLLQRSRREPDALLVQLVDTPGNRRVAWATSTGTDGAGSVLAVSALPDPPTGRGRSDGPFSDLEFALYLGEGDDTSRLLLASLDSVPVPSPRATVEVEFGDQQLTFVARAAGPLAGDFVRRVPWLIAAGGLLFTAAATAGTAVIVRGRNRAEMLAAQLARINALQREHTETLRASLLPSAVTGPPGTTIETGYWPADTSTEISGDFYDAFGIDDRRWAITVGDVCGKGADAAALTSLTRHTIRAAARHSDDPTEVLRWTHEAIAASDADTFATACFAFLSPADDGGVGVDLALAGHPRPILCRGGDASLVGGDGTLLGMVEPHLTSTRLQLVAGDLLVVYTDGLTDVPGALLTPDELVEIVCAVATSRPGRSVAEEIRTRVQRGHPHGSPDDIAILALHIGDPTDGPLPER